MEEVLEVPARHAVGELLDVVVLAEQLHAHHGEDEDDDDEHEAEVTERTHRAPDDADEQVERRPRLRQLEDTQLQCKGDLGLARALTRVPCIGTEKLVPLSFHRLM